MPVLIIVQGVPAAGKTTLVKRLKKDLGLPAVGKDDIKEPLYVTLGAADLKEKMILGRAAMEMLYVLAEQILTAGRSLIIEAPFFPEFANDRLQGIISRTNAHALQVHCVIDIATAKERFIARNESGERHTGHRDNLHYALIEDPAYWRRYGRLDVEPTFTLNTSTHDSREYDELVTRIRTILRNSSKDLTKEGT